MYADFISLHEEAALKLLKPYSFIQVLLPAAAPAPKADMKIPALAEKLELKTLVKLLGDADLVDALNGDGKPF